MIAALIPARKGSEEIPGKNFRLLNGKPLIRWTIDAAVKSGVFDKIIVSSDGGWSLVDSKSPTLDTIKTYNGILVDDNRPADLATSDASLDDLLCYYAGEHPGVKMWCLLQPTSPLRTASDIKKAFTMASKDKHDSVVSVTPGTCMYWIKDSVGMMVEGRMRRSHTATYQIHNRPNRQERHGVWFRENGAIYFAKDYLVEHLGLRVGGTIGLYRMPAERSFEIDSELDWKIVEFMMNGKR